VVVTVTRRWQVCGRLRGWSDVCQLSVYRWRRSLTFLRAPESRQVNTVPCGDSDRINATKGSHSSESNRSEDLWPSLRPTPETTPDTTSATAVESFPSMKLPPNGFLVKDHKELGTYLQSSPELFEAYVSEFGIRVQKDFGLSIDDTVQFEPLKQWVSYDSSIYWAHNDIRPELADYFCQMVFMKSADMIGVMFLNKVFDGWITQNEISSQSPDDVKKEASQFYEVAMEVHETVVLQPWAPAAVGLHKAFDARYMDPHHCHE